METPFEYPINVTWGDCDPARIAYTARLPAFSLEAINGWWRRIWTVMAVSDELDRNVGTPFVKLGMEFLSPVTRATP